MRCSHLQLCLQNRGGHCQTAAHHSHKSLTRHLLTVHVAALKCYTACTETCTACCLALNPIPCASVDAWLLLLARVSAIQEVVQVRRCIHTTAIWCRCWCSITHVGLRSCRKCSSSCCCCCHCGCHSAWHLRHACMHQPSNQVRCTTILEICEPCLRLHVGPNLCS